MKVNLSYLSDCSTLMFSKRYGSLAKQLVQYENHSACYDRYKLCNMIMHQDVNIDATQYYAWVKSLLPRHVAAHKKINF